MDSWLTNPGLDHIPRQIFNYLDLVTISRCLNVSKTWKTFIEKDKSVWLLKLKHLRYYWTHGKGEKVECTRLHGIKFKTYTHDPVFRKRNHLAHWKYIMDHFETQPVEDLKEIVYLAKDYFFREDGEKFCYGYYSPLHHAARIGCLRIIKFCLDQGFSFNLKYNKGFWIVGNKQKSGYSDEPDLDLDMARRFPLHMACQYQQTEIVRLILSYAGKMAIGLGHSAYDSYGTPLHIACKSGNVEIIQMLLEFVKDPKSLKTMSFSERKNYVDPNCETDGRQTPFHLACMDGNIEVVKLMIEMSEKIGVNLNAKDSGKRTALHWASFKGKGQLEVVKLILKYSQSKKIDLNPQHYYGGTPFSVACEWGMTDIVQCFLEHLDKGIDVNTTDKIGRTPLHRAASEGHIDVVKLLLAHKESKGDIILHVYDKNFKTPIQLAYEKGHEDILMLFLSFRNEMIVDLNQSFKEESSLLHWACKNGRDDIVSIILTLANKRHLFIDVNKKDEMEMTPLHHACKNGFDEIVKIFFQHVKIRVFKYDFSAVDEMAMTALDHARAEGHHNIVKHFSDFISPNQKSE